MQGRTQLTPRERILASHAALSKRMVEVSVTVTKPIVPATAERYVTVSVGGREPQRFSNVGQAATFLENAEHLLP